jgi:hypothetical protein
MAIYLRPRKPIDDGFWTWVESAGEHEMPADLRKVGHVRGRVETSEERAREALAYLSEVHEFDSMPIEIVDDNGEPLEL